MKINYSMFLLALLIALSGVFSFTTPSYAALADIQTCDDSLFAGGDGTEGSPWQISTSTELYNVTFCSDTNNQGNYFILTDDIDLNGFENMYTGNDEAGWMPIGSYYDEDAYYEGEFYGFFDGNYHVISGLNIDQRDQYYQGLFGLIRQGSIVENLGVVDASITGPQNIGIIAGNLDGTIRTSYVKNSVASSTDDDALGGMVSYLDSFGLIEESYVYNVDILGSRDSALGGIAAAMSSEGQISRVYAQGTITLTDSESTGSVGGITGGWYGSTELENSFSIAELSYEGTDPYIGGITAKWGEPSELGNNYWYNPEEGGIDACIGSDIEYEGGFCTSSTTTDQFKNANNEPLASWDIATTDDEDYDSLNDGFPFLAWEKDGDGAETIWLVFGDIGPAPEILSTTPTEGETGVSVNTSITIEFSVPMDTESNIIISTGPCDEVCPAGEISSWTEGDQVATITFPEPLLPGTTYTIGLSNLMSAQGASYDGEFELSFTTLEVDDDQPRRSGGSSVKSRVKKLQDTGNVTAANDLIQKYDYLFSSDYSSASSSTINTDVRNLFVGLSGADVKALQNLLISLGYAIPAGPTGYFANQTQSALSLYQKENNIVPAIGYFGPITRAQMKAAGLTGLWW